MHRFAGDLVDGIPFSLRKELKENLPQSNNKLPAKLHQWNTEVQKKQLPKNLRQRFSQVIQHAAINPLSPLSQKVLWSKECQIKEETNFEAGSPQSFNGTSSISLRSC